MLSPRRDQKKEIRHGFSLINTDMHGLGGILNKKIKGVGFKGILYFSPRSSGDSGEGEIHFHHEPASPVFVWVEGMKYGCYVQLRFF